MKNGELEVGDVVEILEDNPSGSRFLAGELVTIISVDSSAYGGGSSGYLPLEESRFHGRLRLYDESKRSKPKNKTKAFVLR